MLQTLRHKLTRRYLLVLGLVIAGYSLGTFALVREVMTWGIDEANHHLALPFTTLFERPGGTIEGATAELQALGLVEGEHVELLDAEGRVLASRGGPFIPPPPLVVGISTLASPEPTRVLTVPLERGGALVGYVRASHSLAMANRVMTTFALTLVGLLPLALLVAWAIADWLSIKAVAPVEAAIMRERQFTRDASHELRTPLAVLQAQAELARGQAPAGPVREKLDLILKTTRRLSALVADLLTLSREDAGVEGAALTFGLDEVLEEEIELLAPLARDRGVKLQAGPVTEAARMRGEPGRVAQAVRNLIDNAIRYAPSGGRVDVTLAREGGRLVLRVGNDGPPIPDSERGRIFERFHRAEAGRTANPDGSGLGLAISRAIAVAHGGELHLASRPGERTAFTLALPAES
ncbi:MAG: sensor histidine kinase [Candidatus Sericytochromatia bacterium]